jgi:C-terminal processing protease CtpA/Prc
MNNRITLFAVVLFVVLHNTVSVHADSAFARKYIIDNYYKPLPPKAMMMPHKTFHSLIHRWSWIVSRQRWESFNNSIRGQHTGRVGITIQAHPLGKRVIFVVPGGPAYYSGLMVGDVIESVNGELLTRPNANGEYPEIRRSNGMGCPNKNGHVSRLLLEFANVRSFVLTWANVVEC